jgi:hypothetical protein
LGEHRRAGGQQWIVDMGRELGERGTKPPTPFVVAGQQAMHFEGGRQPVRGGSGQSGSLTQFGQPAGGFRDRVQQPHTFVEYADSAMLSHKEILASRIMRLQPESIGESRMR